MIRYYELEISNESDYDKLNKEIKDAEGMSTRLIPSEYIDGRALEMIKKMIGTRCNKILIETPYYDKDYLSTFYIFYAKKFKKYDKRNIRLIFLTESNGIIGYVTLRPTTERTKLGKTYINPKYILDESENVSTYIIMSNQKAHINKQSVYISCFPWMCQQEDITICAHIALWSLIRVLSAKSNIYAEVSLGEIAEQVEHYSEKIHSPGLTPQQISTILMKNDLATVIHHMEDYREHFSEMISYIDSGFAFIGVLSKYTHAVAVIGYDINKSMLLETEDADIKAYVDEVSIKIKSNGEIITGNANGDDVKMKIVPHSSLAKSLIVNDDQFTPYKRVPILHENLVKSEPQDGNKDNIFELEYMGMDIDCIVVPFYNRIQLSYKDAFAKFSALVVSEKNHFQWTNENTDTIFVRGFLAHTNDYKEYALENWGKKEGLICWSLEVPKYCWCFEVSSLGNYVNNKVDSVVLMDSTASANDSDFFIYVRDAKACYYFEDGIRTQSISDVPIPCFKGGVERIK